MYLVVRQMIHCEKRIERGLEVPFRVKSRLLRVRITKLEIFQDRNP